MKLLIYLIDLKEYDILRSYFISEIGEDLYNSYVSMRAIIDPSGIEELLKPKKLNSKVKSIIKLLISGIGQFEEVLKPDKIQSLNYYFKNYKKFDPEKKFKDNKNLVELITDDLNLKISQTLYEIRQLKNNDVEKIKLQEYLKDLQLLRKN